MNTQSALWCETHIHTHTHTHTEVQRQQRGRWYTAPLCWKVCWAKEKVGTEVRGKNKGDRSWRTERRWYLTSVTQNPVSLNRREPRPRFTRAQSGKRTNRMKKSLVRGKDKEANKEQPTHSVTSDGGGGDCTWPSTRKAPPSCANFHKVKFV